jgi:hypothetical protein
MWNDGSTYAGEWERGLPHGKGTFFLTKLGVFKVNGQKPKAGFFEDNVLVK